MEVSNWAATSAFYQDVLGAELVEREPGRYAFKCGLNQINIAGPSPLVRPLRPMVAGSVDMCFVWPGPVAAARAHLESRGVPIIAGPVARVGAGGPGNSVYFRDPEGNLLEFISYDPDGAD